MKISKFILSCLIVCCLLITQVHAKSNTKNKCQKYLNQVRSIQAKQREGYSAQQGNQLRQKEAKARDNWWKCKNSSPNKMKNKGKNKAKNKGKNKAKKKVKNKLKAKKKVRAKKKSKIQ